MMKKIFVLLLPACLLPALLCTELPSAFVHNNALDPKSPEWHPGSVLIAAKGTTFIMGQLNVAVPAFGVSFTYNYYIDTTEITRKEYARVMGQYPSGVNDFLQNPVEQVTWFDAALYCNARSREEGKDTVYSYTGVTGIPGAGCTGLANLSIDLTAIGYRLPTEAEWEYACRGKRGQYIRYFWGSDTIGMGTYAWSMINSPYGTQPVATRQPNDAGLYDMIGNVREWCNDWYEGYSTNPKTDPAGPVSGMARAVRSGSFITDPSLLASAWRESADPSSRAKDLGFRCVLRAPGSIPVIDSQPGLLSAAIGEILTMTVRVKGYPDPVFQWEKNSQPIKGATGASYTISPILLADSGTYRVIATNRNGSDTSKPIPVTVSRRAARPSLKTPLDSATGVNTLPTALVWNGVSGVMTYIVQVSIDSLFTVIIVSQSSVSSSLSLTSLNYGTRYFWRVNATNNYGVSTWSDVWYFTTMK